MTTDAINIAETLGNLAYLIRMDAENPGLVRSYVDLAEERLRSLGELLRRMAPCAE